MIIITSMFVLTNVRSSCTKYGIIRRRLKFKKLLDRTRKISELISTDIRIKLLFEIVSREHERCSYLTERMTDLNVVPIEIYHLFIIYLQRSIEGPRRW